MEITLKFNVQQDFQLGPVSRQEQHFWQGPPERNEINKKIARKWERRLAMQIAIKIAKQDTAIVDLGASGWYFTPDAPISNLNKTAATILVGTATGQAQTSEASCELPLPDIPPGLFGHIMSVFTHNFLALGIFVINIAESSSPNTRLLSMTATISLF